MKILILLYLIIIPISYIISHKIHTRTVINDRASRYNNLTGELLINMSLFNKLRYALYKFLYNFFHATNWLVTLCSSFWIGYTYGRKNRNGELRQSGIQTYVAISPLELAITIGSLILTIVLSLAFVGENDNLLVKIFFWISSISFVGYLLSMIITNGVFASIKTQFGNHYVNYALTFFVCTINTVLIMNVLSYVYIFNKESFNVFKNTFNIFFYNDIRLYIQGYKSEVSFVNIFLTLFSVIYLALFGKVLFFKKHLKRTIADYLDLSKSGIQIGDFQKSEVFLRNIPHTSRNYHYWSNLSATHVGLEEYEDAQKTIRNILPKDKIYSKDQLNHRIVCMMIEFGFTSNEFDSFLIFWSRQSETHIYLCHILLYLINHRQDDEFIYTVEYILEKEEEKSFCDEYTNFWSAWDNNPLEREEQDIPLLNLLILDSVISYCIAENVKNKHFVIDRLVKSMMTNSSLLSNSYDKSLAFQSLLGIYHILKSQELDYQSLIFNHLEDIAAELNYTTEFMELNIDASQVKKILDYTFDEKP